MKAGDLVTRKSGGPVMAVIGGVRSPTPPNNYTKVTCLWFDKGQQCQSAISAEDVEPASGAPSAELAAYVARRRAHAIASRT